MCPANESYKPVIPPYIIWTCEYYTFKIHVKISFIYFSLFPSGNDYNDMNIKSQIVNPKYVVDSNLIIDIYKRYIHIYPNLQIISMNIIVKATSIWSFNNFLLRNWEQKKTFE